MMKYTVRLGDAQRTLSDPDFAGLDLIESCTGWHLVHENVTYTIKDVRCDPEGGIVSLRLDGELFEVVITDEIEERVSALGLSGRADERPDFLAAPMPGLVLEVLVQSGQKVEAGQPLVVLQAMKMENLLKASFPLIVGDILVTSQQKVEKGEKMILFEGYE